MVQAKAGVISDFRKFMRKCGPSRSEAYLFGSRIRGDALAGSDLDAIIVSNDFQGTDFFKRMADMSKAWYDFFGPAIILEPLCYTRSEFAAKRNEIGIVSEALKYAVKV
jgi:predicted nucleotidyltransferase